MDEAPFSFSAWSLASRTPSEVRALTAAPSSPALASASALLVGSKEPYLRTRLGLSQSSWNIPFLNVPMLWRTLLTTVLPLMLLGRMSLGKEEERFQCTSFFSPRASEARSFTEGRGQGSCVSGQGLECPRRGEDLLWL